MTPTPEDLERAKQNAPKLVDMLNLLYGDGTAKLVRDAKGEVIGIHSSKKIPPFEEARGAIVKLFEQKWGAA